ncbi:hypothetical protein [Pelagibacterium lentulum]|uniref:Uncharacterized protein n=1 Tax=Pelagibacterium lentulum TaxID=2029865 RepID=A0A916RG19_9HYPH|nr:hypothetical protein [Pelagibacterium lentulum]GGA54732.1 hypothetical protein GCM10011499_26120 [Pelagibacterium lentulum]
MFLVRSAFWLTAAWLVIAPAHHDFSATADAAGAEIVKGGQALISAGLSRAPECASFECAAGRAILETAINQPAQVPQIAPQPHLTVAASPVQAPVPPRRPDWAS